MKIKAILTEAPDNSDIIKVADFARISRYNIRNDEHNLKQKMFDDCYISYLPEKQDIKVLLEARKTINNLIKWKHYTPLRKFRISFELIIPLFVAEQLMRHTVGIIYNRMSLRYNKKPLGFYEVNDEINESYQKSLKAYEKLIENKFPAEVARAVLPSGTMTVLGVEYNYESFERVINERLLNETAQKETRDTVKKMARLASLYYPFNQIKGVERY